MTPTSKPAVTPEMLEKARQFYAQDVGVGAANYATEVGRLEGQGRYRIELMARFAASAVQDAVSDAIKLVEHFANDELTPKEWPEHGLVKREGRFDNGFVAVTCEHIAAALREKYGVKP